MSGLWKHLQIVEPGVVHFLSSILYAELLEQHKNFIIRLGLLCGCHVCIQVKYVLNLLHYQCVSHGRFLMTPSTRTSFCNLACNYVYRYLESRMRRCHAADDFLFPSSVRTSSRCMKNCCSTKSFFIIVTAHIQHCLCWMSFTYNKMGFRVLFPWIRRVLAVMSIA